jgi:hypothetical protein
MAQLAVAAVMMAAGVYKGVQSRKVKYGEAEGYLDASNRRTAAMTRDVESAERKKESLENRALAVGAVLGGGGLGSSGMTRIVGDLNAEGEYNVLAKMYMGMEEADALTYRAEAARREGDAAFQAGVIDGVVSAVSSYYGMGGKFGSTTSPPTSARGSMGSNVSLKIPGAQSYAAPGGLDVSGYNPSRRNA